MAVKTMEVSAKAVYLSVLGAFVVGIAFGIQLGWYARKRMAKEFKD